MNRFFDISEIDKSQNQRKGIIQSLNYGSYASPKIYEFDSCLDDEHDENIFDMNHNNEIEYICFFDDNMSYIDHCR